MTPFRVGLVVGVGAAVVQAFFGVLPPPAYGMCIACHMRDLVNWLLVRLWPVYGVVDGVPKFIGAGVSLGVPVLTVVGVFLGALVAALRHGEVRLRVMRFGPQRPFWELLIGSGMMISALLMGGCPIRTALKAAYLDIMALIALGMIFLGVVCGCEVLKRTS